MVSQCFSAAYHFIRDSDAGLRRLQSAMDSRYAENQQYWYIGCISAAVTSACAVLILVNPFTSAASLWIFIGVTMIVEAGLDIVTLYFWKK